MISGLHRTWFLSETEIGQDAVMQSIAYRSKSQRNVRGGKNKAFSEFQSYSCKTY